MSKGLIKFLVIVVSLACLYSLSFTFVTRKVEKDAAEYAKGDMAKEKAYLDSIAGEVVYNIGIAKFTYREAKANERYNGNFIERTYRKPGRKS
jgi:SecD/SecF fusion protein